MHSVCNFFILLLYVYSYQVLEYTNIISIYMAHSQIACFIWHLNLVIILILVNIIAKEPILWKTKICYDRNILERTCSKLENKIFLSVLYTYYYRERHVCIFPLGSSAFNNYNTFIRGK